MSEVEEESLFNALLDEPEYYELNGKKIPIHSLGISIMPLLLRTSSKVPNNIKTKILNNETLTKGEEETLENIQNDEKNDKDTLMRKLLLKTLKLTFPTKSDNDLDKISVSHWNPLIKIIMKVNFPKISSIEKDFQNPQLKKNL